VREVIDEYQETKKRQIELAKHRARLHDQGELSVATSYGQCPSSQTGAQLLDEFECDVVVLCQPGGDVNVRTADSHPISFEIADLMGGGGREFAAGATPDWFGDGSDRIPWTEHWATMGDAARDRVVDVVSSTLG
jgi:hypothetical protein